MEKPKLIIKRGDHYEVHFANKVEFRSLEGDKLGESEVTKWC